MNPIKTAFAISSILSFLVCMLMLQGIRLWSFLSIIVLVHTTIDTIWQELKWRNNNENTKIRP